VKVILSEELLVILKTMDYTWTELGHTFAVQGRIAPAIGMLLVDCEMQGKTLCISESHLKFGDADFFSYCEKLQRFVDKVRVELPILCTQTGSPHAARHALLHRLAGWAHMC
jgi:hypothetical protein